MPSFDIGGMDVLPIAGLAIVAVAAVAFVLVGGGGGEGGDEAAAAPSAPAASSSSGTDLSIPYDAAARLAYDKAKGGSFDAADYAKFKADYEEKAVKEVIAKKKARGS